MRSSDELQINSKAVANQPELEILSELEDTPDITQRELSKRVGIALGLTNLLLRNMTKKGYLRVSQATWKRRLYTLTPEGFSHKIRLMTGYVNRVLRDYNKVRQSLRLQLGTLSLHVESRIALYGSGEFAELIYLGLREFGIEEIAVYTENGAGLGEFLGIQIQELSKLDSSYYDWIFISQLNGLDTARTKLIGQGVNKDKLVTFFDNQESRG